VALGCRAPIRRSKPDPRSKGSSFAPEKSQETLPPKMSCGSGKGPSRRVPHENPEDLLQGRLDLPVLEALAQGAVHGSGVAEWIHQTSEDILRVEESALNRALDRLELRGLLRPERDTSDNNRRVRFYSRAAAGRKRLTAETKFWCRMSGAVLLLASYRPSRRATAIDPKARATNKRHARPAIRAAKLCLPATPGFPQGISQATVLPDGLRPLRPSATFKLTLLRGCSKGPAVIRKP
jgi:PadR family transcriptional regulator PadR